LNPTTAILPLVFVIAVSMLREGIEDYMRYRSDKGKLIYSSDNNLFENDVTYIKFIRRVCNRLNYLDTNSQTVWILKNGHFVQARSDEIVVGDIVKIEEDDIFAADFIVLTTSQEGGFCFI
jgi:magnesium-transporting ATPase (P-type)